MTRRVLVQGVLVVGVVVALLLSAGAIDLGSETGSSPDDAGAGADAIDLIDEAEIDVDLGEGWTLVDEWYVESTDDVDGWCNALGRELSGSLTEWSSADGDASVLLIGYDWKAPELAAELRGADCSRHVHVLRRENIVSLVWFSEGSTAVVDLVLASVNDAMNAAVPYLVDQPRPAEPTGVPAMTVEAVFIPDELCTNAGRVHVGGDSWPTDHESPLPASWRQPDGVAGVLAAEGLDGVFTGPEGLTIRVTKDYHELRCTIG